MSIQKLLCTMLLVINGFTTSAQVYAEQKTQHRFAQTYVGLNMQFVPASGRLVWEDQPQKFPAQGFPRLTIGGLHFWGKLDFNMNIPLKGFGSRELLDQEGEVTFRTGADLSVRYYPWRLMFGRLRPFTGLSFNTMQLELGSEQEGQRIDGFITSSLLIGFSFAQNGWQANAELMFLPQNKRDFYSSTQQKNRFELPRSYLSIGLIKYFDFTLVEEAPKLSGKTAILERQLAAQQKLNSLCIGIAPSSTFFADSPSFSGDIASIPRHRGSFNWEFALGYLFQQSKLHLGLTYRTNRSNAVSYHMEHVVRREALSLELFRFLGNYHGFVPFAGLSLSAERWATGLFIHDVQQGQTHRSRMLSPGLIFGWDILPSPLETWVLRTNLRYYPFQKINDLNGQRSRVDQFEFNFIQFVFYPNRWKHIRRAKRDYTHKY